LNYINTNAIPACTATIHLTMFSLIFAIGHSLGSLGEPVTFKWRHKLVCGRGRHRE